MLQVFDERNRDLIVNVGGRLSHRDRAAVSPFDSAVQGGDGKISDVTISYPLDLTAQMLEYAGVKR